MTRQILVLAASMLFTVSLVGCESTQESYSLTGDETATDETVMNYPYDPNKLQDANADY